MTDFHLDLVNGVDGNDGTTWAKAGKTLYNAWNFWAVNPGDRIKVAKTPDPVSFGINATWVDNNIALTLASALTINIDDCEAAWTPSANITQADETYYYKEGTKSRKITPAAAFGTGLMAYKATGTINLSSKTKISFWIRVSATVSANTLKISLCSDVAGATPVNNATIDFTMYANMWYPVTITCGALGAAIKSVALYALLDPGTAVIYLDNILACSTLNLKSLIGKNIASDTFWPIRSINGTTVKVGLASDNATYGLVYRGVSETRTIYYRDVFSQRYPMSSSDYYVANPPDGAVGNVIHISGGWNTATNLIDGETWFDGLNNNGEGCRMINTDYVKWSKFAFMRFYYGVNGYDNNTGIELDNVECSFSASYGIRGYSSAPLIYDSDSWVLTNIRLFGNSSMGIYTSDCHRWSLDTLLAINTYYAVDAWKNNYSSWKNVTSKYNSSYGLLIQNSYNITVDGLNSVNSDYCALNLSNCPNAIVKNLTINGCGSDNIRANGCSGMVMETINTINSADNGIDINSSINVKIKDLISSGNVGGALFLYYSQVYLNNPLICDTIKIVFYTSYAHGRDDFVSCKKFYQINNYHKVFNYTGIIHSEQIVRHTASGLAWALAPEHVTQKLRFPPNNFKFTCLANKEVTIDIYVQKSSTYNGNAPRLVLVGGVLSNISSDVFDSLSVGADTWEDLQVKGTPSEDGVLEFYVDCDGNAGRIYVDDIAIVQAA